LAGELGFPDRIALRNLAQVTSWRELAAEFAAQRKWLDPLAGRRVGLALRADRQGIASLAALESLACDAFLFDAQLPVPQRVHWCETLGLNALLPSDNHLASPHNAAAAPADACSTPASSGDVVILTSGTTGEPKAVRHSWAGLTRPVRQQAADSPPCWLLAFRPHLYAGLQVILQSLLNQGTLVVAPAEADPAEIAQLMAVAGVEYASATPSYWRRLLMSADAATLRRVPLLQITLGGEVVDQAILDALHQVFPRARLAHIYATTELGRCFSVTDGRAGFPRSLLERASSDGVELQVRDGELWVRSANAMTGYDPQSPLPPGQADAAGWFATGDLVEQQGDRVYFAGRNSEMINVGGNKVSPVAVERVIRQLPEVAEVRVFGQASSLAGQLVACQVVPVAGVEAELLRQRVRQHCQAQLDRYQCPRLIEVVSRLPLSDAGKLVR
jgi:acyl-CoA synthetase (AMP-forming)/AMP-acid ligase II